MRRIINSNYDSGSSRFITLTFKENIQDLKFANNEFSLFVKRFQYYLGYKLQYSAVIEFQKRGAIHYHTMFYNIPDKLDLPRCREIWGHGSFNCKLIDHVDNVGAYMVKYMAKNNMDDRLKGKKMYFNSRKLKHATEIKEKNLVHTITKSLTGQAPKYENTFVNDYNSVSYKQFIIK